MPSLSVHVFIVLYVTAIKGAFYCVTESATCYCSVLYASTHMYFYLLMHVFLHIFLIDCPL